MFELSQLPRFTFVEDGTENVLDPADSGERIQRIADLVVQRFQEGATVGIIFRSGPESGLLWLGVLLAGRTP